MGNTKRGCSQGRGRPYAETPSPPGTYYWQDFTVGSVLAPAGACRWWAFCSGGLGCCQGVSRPSLADGTVIGRIWLLAYLVGAYLAWSAIVNKDQRYIAPLLPALAVFLAWGLVCWWRKWPWVTIATLMVGTLAALLSIFPTGFQSLGNVMVPNSSFYAYRV